MNGFSPFLKKEFFELYRKGRLLLFCILSVFFGILAPATAKLTPAIFKLMNSEFEQQGITVTSVTVTAYNSWEQFFGNLPVLLIVFVIVFSGSVTGEFSKPTAIPLLTKGLSRSAFMLSKLTAATVLWSAGLWLCFGITYGYTAYYWENSTVSHLYSTILLWWLFSLGVIGMMFMFSSLLNTSSQVMLCTGTVVFCCYLLGIVKSLKKFLPTTLAGGSAFINGSQSLSQCTPAIVITALAAVVSSALAVTLIGKRKV